VLFETEHFPADSKISSELSNELKARS